MKTDLLMFVTTITRMPFFSSLNGYHVATVKEDDEFWYVDNNCGAGWGEYPKADWTLERAIYDQCIDEHIN